jgi:hypothetical protein
MFVWEAWISGGPILSALAALVHDWSFLEGPIGFGIGVSTASMIGKVIGRSNVL